MINLSLCLVFDDDTRSHHVAAQTEVERDSWMELLQLASYECMKFQLISLQEQIQEKQSKLGSALEQNDHGVTSSCIEGAIHYNQTTMCRINLSKCMMQQNLKSKLCKLAPFEQHLRSLYVREA